MRILHTSLGRDGTTIVIHQTGPISYPIRPFGVKLPSGLIHWFETECEALASQYWPCELKPRHPGLHQPLQPQFQGPIRK